MTRERVGLPMFWIGVAGMIAWLIVGIIKIAPLMRSLTTEEMNQTIWAFGGPLSFLYGVSIPLGAIVAGAGVLLQAGARSSTVWKVGIGLIVVLVVAFVAMGLNFYSAPVFGIGGSLILLSLARFSRTIGSRVLASKCGNPVEVPRNQPPRGNPQKGSVEVCDVRRNCWNLRGIA